jgi:hypothetical protein
LGEFLPIGRLFTLGRLLKITKVAQIIGLLFSTAKKYVLILTKMGSAMFFAILLQTPLVTLVGVFYVLGN